jgi:hypothetical protein
LKAGMRAHILKPSLGRCRTYTITDHCNALNILSPENMLYSVSARQANDPQGF